jgi:hypothetical protein
LQSAGIIPGVVTARAASTNTPFALVAGALAGVETFAEALFFRVGHHRIKGFLDIMVRYHICHEPLREILQIFRWINSRPNSLGYADGRRLSGQTHHAMVRRKRVIYGVKLRQSGKRTDTHSQPRYRKAKRWREIPHECGVFPNVGHILLVTQGRVIAGVCTRNAASATAFLARVVGVGEIARRVYISVRRDG